MDILLTHMIGIAAHNPCSSGLSAALPEINVKAENIVTTIKNEILDWYCPFCLTQLKGREGRAWCLCPDPLRCDYETDFKSNEEDPPLSKMQMLERKISQIEDSIKHHKKQIAEKITETKKLREELERLTE